MDKKESLNHKDAADYLGVASQTLYNWRCRRHGPDYVLMGRKVIYLRSDLNRFIESNRVKLNGGV